jgi:predicted nuclease with TOPRIM domain
MKKFAAMFTFWKTLFSVARQLNELSKGFDALVKANSLMSASLTAEIEELNASVTSIKTEAKAFQNEFWDIDRKIKSLRADLDEVESTTEEINNIDYYALADEISKEDVASYIDEESVASYIEIDEEAIALAIKRALNITVDVNIER